MTKTIKPQSEKETSSSDFPDNVDLISLIYEHMQSDDECPLKQSQYLVSAFDGADAKGKQLIDDVLICVCGFSLTTVINQAVK